MLSEQLKYHSTKLHGHPQKCRDIQNQKKKFKNN